MIRIINGFFYSKSKLVVKLSIKNFIQYKSHLKLFQLKSIPRRGTKHMGIYLKSRWLGFQHDSGQSNRKPNTKENSYSYFLIILRPLDPTLPC